MVRLMPLLLETHNLLPHLNVDWFYLSGIGLPRLEKRPLNGRSSSVLLLQDTLSNAFQLSRRTALVVQ